MKEKEIDKFKILPSSSSSNTPLTSAKVSSSSTIDIRYLKVCTICMTGAIVEKTEDGEDFVQWSGRGLSGDRNIVKNVKDIDQCEK